MPKMVFSTGGDEFFLPDDSHYYFSDMKGPKYVNMLPNAEHSCAGHVMQLMFNIEAFYVSVMKVGFVNIKSSIIRFVIAEVCNEFAGFIYPAMGPSNTASFEERLQQEQVLGNTV